MIDWLIFSRDRPLQLDGLLTSFDRHAPHLQGSVTVLRYSSTPRFELGYLSVADTHGFRVGTRAFWRQGPSFEQDVREWLSGAGDHIGFLVDDDLFVRDAPAASIVLPQAYEACYALRLRYPDGLPGDGRRTWVWRTATELDYGYPLALDGHVYRRETIEQVMDGLSFDDPTRLEAGMAARADELAEPLMAAAERQCLVGIPTNRVSPSSGMPYMSTYPEYTAEALLERYLEGWRLSPRGMVLEQVSSAHAEIPLAFELAEATVRA